MVNNHEIRFLFSVLSQVTGSYTASVFSKTVFIIRYFYVCELRHVSDAYQTVKFKISFLLRADSSFQFQPGIVVVLNFAR